MMKTLTKSALSLLLLAWLMIPAISISASEIQSLQSILTTAESFLKDVAQAQHSGRTDVKMGHLDRRLRLSKCEQALEAFQPSGARSTGRTSVGVRCGDAGGWTIYVPAEVDVFGQALVTTRSLPRGIGLGPNDVKLVEAEVSGLGHGYLEAMADIEGLVTRRPIAAGTVLTPAMVKAPQLIKRGDRVRLLSGDGPIQVEMLGEAIEAAARGERVRVRALDSKRIVEGWVVSASVVKMTL